MERLLTETLEWATGREQGGARLWDHQGVSFPLADSAADAAAGRLLVLEVARLADAGADLKVVHAKASMAKLFVSEAACRCADRAVQAFGGRGYRRDNVAERLLRELRVDRIWEGTSEIQRLIIARSLERRGVGDRCSAERASRRCSRPALGRGRRRDGPAGLLRRRDAAQPRGARVPRPGLGRAPDARVGARTAVRAVARRPARAGGRGRGRDPGRGRAGGRAGRRPARLRRARRLRGRVRRGAGRPALQAELREAATAAGLPVIGPNCDGIVAFHSRAALWGDALVPRPSRARRARLAERERRGQRARARGAGCASTRSPRSATRRSSTPRRCSRRCARTRTSARSRSSWSPTATARG